MKVDRLNKLAELFELKCNLKLGAARLPLPPPLPFPEATASAKKEIKEAYKMYVDGKTAKEPIIQMLSNDNQPYPKLLAASMKKFISEIDFITPLKIFNRANKIAKSIRVIAAYNESGARHTIQDNTRRTRESEDNYRELIKSKFGMILMRLSSMLVNAATVLAGSLNIDFSLLATKIEAPPIKELSKDALLRFTRTPQAKQYGLDSLYVIQVALQRNRPLVTNFINSISRGHVPKAGPELKKLTDNIRSEFALKGTNVESLDEQSEQAYEPPESLFEEDIEEPHFIEGDPHRADPSVLDPMVDVRKMQQVKKEEEEKANRRKEWEEKMMSKYNSASLYKFLRKV